MLEAELEKLEVYFVGINEPLVTKGDDALILWQELRLRAEENLVFRYLDYKDGKYKDLFIHGKNIAYCNYYEGRRNG